MSDHEASVTMEAIVCPKCGIPFAVPREFFDARAADGGFFWCMNACNIQLGAPSSSDRMVRALTAELDRQSAELQAICLRNLALRRENSDLRRAVVDHVVGPATAQEGT